MRKNKMMRLASMLLVLCLLTTSVISGTFAKYTTQDSADDTARVAKWGVTLQIDGNLYGDTYKDSIVLENATDFTVQSVDKDADLVAPGTKNEEGFTFSLNGTPEVAGQVVATVAYENVYLTEGEYGVMVPIDVVTAANFDEFYDNATTPLKPTEKLYKAVEGGYEEATAWEDGKEYFTLEDYVDLTDDYYPVEYKMVGGSVNDTSYNKNFDAALNVNTLEEIVAKFTELGASTSTTTNGRVTKVYEAAGFAPNDDLAKIFKLEDQTITWKWDFCQKDAECDNGDAACEHCKADSILGQLMAKDTTGETMRVVKLDKNIYKTPVAATGTEAMDYNLDSYFSIDITVTQVN